MIGSIDPDAQPANGGPSTGYQATVCHAILGFSTQLPLIRPFERNRNSFWRATRAYHRLKVSQSLGGDRCFPVGGKSTVGQSGRRVSGSLPGRCAFGCVTVPATTIEAPKSIDGLHLRVLRLARCAAYSFCPERAQYNSPGQRPGERFVPTYVSPERAV